MATYQKATNVTLIAGENLRNSIFELLTINNAGRVVKADAVTEVVIGVLAENPRSDVVTTGHSVSVAIVGAGGILKVKASAAISAGALVVPSATDGKAGSVANIGALAVDQMAFGIALEAATAENQIIPVLVQTIAAPHSA